MKFKFVPFLIAFGFSLLLGYAFFAANGGEQYNWVQFLVSGLSLLVILGGGIGFQYAEKGGVNIVITSVLFAIAEIVVNLIFTFIPNYSIPAYTITSGLILLIDIGIIYSLAKALQE